MCCSKLPAYDPIAPSPNNARYWVMRPPPAQSSDGKAWNQRDRLDIFPWH
jgi:hypothetical protein